MGVEDRFIGRGWAFPPAFTRSGPAENLRGATELSEGVEDIRQSLWIIINTSLGERLMRPDFGCNLADRLFDAMNASMISYIENLVKTAILYHEPRIDADDITVVAHPFEGRLDIGISYIVRGANSRFNMVYPFYLKEG